MAKNLTIQRNKPHFYHKAYSGGGIRLAGINLDISWRIQFHSDHRLSADSTVGVFEYCPEYTRLYTIVQENTHVHTVWSS